MCFARDECLALGALQTRSLEEQLVEPLPARMDLYGNRPGHDEPSGQPGTGRDRSALSCSRPSAATPVLIGDGLYIPSRPFGRPSRTGKTPGIPTNYLDSALSAPRPPET